MSPDRTPAQTGSYDQAMAASDQQIHTLIGMLMVGTDTRGETEAVLNVYAYVAGTFDQQSLAELLTAAIARLGKIERESFARDGAAQFGLLARIRPRGSAIAGDLGTSRAGTVVAVSPGQVGVLLDRERKAGSPRSRYQTMPPLAAAHYYEQAGHQAQLPPADLALLDALLPADDAARVRSLNAPTPAQPSTAPPRIDPQAEPGPGGPLPASENQTTRATACALDEPRPGRWNRRRQPDGNANGAEACDGQGSEGTT